ncbi:MAG: tRNA1(Val) (adenine(37)-N6)-methyltransferase [Paludibacteraceae bacterium]|nr:tRNA1(Val) (adenine(37)-N6)-methyltransferase [Paludibacteraceae bacterium]
MGSPCFRFKQFTVWHDRCAMKVGTDGVLLGAWCPVGSQARSVKGVKVLDVGTGSGLIALMLAQRLPQAQITAIDIDNGAVEQAQYNFEQSPWKERLHCQQTALQEVEGNSIYDLIVSNPPYFQDSLKNPDSQRAMARHTDTLSYDELLANSARLLKEEGRLALVLPIEAEQQIIALAQTYELYPTHITHVYPKPGKAAKRLLIAFSLLPIANSTSPIANSLTLESETAPRSEEYKELTKDFYL